MTTHCQRHPHKPNPARGFCPIHRLALCLLAICLLCAACANPFRAASMKLQRTEGTVNVHNQKGEELALNDEMNLYSGYEIATKKTSYAWIDLDQERLAKLDAGSDAQIEQSGKELEITINSGKLFFNIATPLEEREQLNIRTSSMMVGIRGTCGWVEIPDDEQMLVYLLEGTVKCTITDPDTSATFSASVSGGEKAHLVVLEDGPDVIVDDLSVGEIPDFVMEELEDDEELCQRILEDSGLDVLSPPEDSEPDPTGQEGESDNLNPQENLPTVPESVVYYGDRNQCRITPEAAEAFAATIREQMALLTKQEEESSMPDFESLYPLRGYAALFDTGNGTPALIFAGGTPNAYEEPREDGASFGYIWDYGIFVYADGQIIPLPPPPDGPAMFRLYPGHLVSGGDFPANPEYSACVYRLDDGFSPSSPDTTAHMAADWSAGQETQFWTIDGAAASQEQGRQWLAQWDPDSFLVSLSHGSDPSASAQGLGPVENVLALLEEWAGN